MLPFFDLLLSILVDLDVNAYIFANAVHGATRNNCSQVRLLSNRIPNQKAVKNTTFPLGNWQHRVETCKDSVLSQLGAAAWRIAPVTSQVLETFPFESEYP